VALLIDTLGTTTQFLREPCREALSATICVQPRSSRGQVGTYLWPHRAPRKALIPSPNSDSVEQTLDNRSVSYKCTPHANHPQYRGLPTTPATRTTVTVKGNGRTRKGRGRGRGRRAGESGNKKLAVGWSNLAAR